MDGRKRAEQKEFPLGDSALPMGLGHAGSALLERGVLGLRPRTTALRTCCNAGHVTRTTWMDQGASSACRSARCRRRQALGRDAR